MEKPMDDVSNEPTQTETGNPSGAVRRVPSWAAGAAVVACVLAAGAFIWWFLGGSFGGNGNLIPDPARDQRVASGRGGWRQAANNDGVTIRDMPKDAKFHQVRAGAAIMEVDVPADRKVDPGYRFRYQSRELLTPAQWQLAQGLARVGQDAQMAKTLDVTPDQLTRLRRYNYIPMEVAAADREKLVALWTEYDKATAKAEPEKKLVAALRDAGNRALAATKVKAAQRVAEIGQILTPAQVRELTKLGAGQPVTAIPPRPKAATAPAAAPTNRRAVPAATRPVTTRPAFRTATTRPTVRLVATRPAVRTAATRLPTTRPR